MRLDSRGGLAVPRGAIRGLLDECWREQQSPGYGGTGHFVRINRVHAFTPSELARCLREGAVTTEFR